MIKKMKYTIVMLILQISLLYSCNSNQIEGVWKVSNLDNNLGLSNVVMVKLLQEEGPISFKFNPDGSMNVINKNGEIIENNHYTIGEQNSIEIINESKKELGKLKYKSSKEVEIIFPNYSYQLVKN